MIQTLGDVLLLVAISSVGLVSFLLAIFLYHRVFVMLDVRLGMKRLIDLAAEVGEVASKPVAIVTLVVDWVQRHLWESYFLDEPKKEKKRKKREKKRKRKK